MSPDKIYVIHYTKLQDRLSYIKPILEGSGRPYEIITEYDREEIGNLNFSLYEINQEMFDEKIKHLWNPQTSKFRIINPSEVSVAAKQFTALKKVSEECPNFGLILEDDAVFNPKFAELYDKNISKTPSDWDAIFIGEGCGIGFINSKINQGQRITDNVYKIQHPATNCAEAYLIKPEAAKRIYESGIPFHIAYDFELAYQFYKLNMNIYWWTPSLVHQGSKSGKYESELDKESRAS